MKIIIGVHFFLKTISLSDLVCQLQFQEVFPEDVASVIKLLPVVDKAVTAAT